MPPSPNDLIWTPRARDDLLDIWNYFAGVASPDVADRLLRDIADASARLVQNPLLGRARDDVFPALRQILMLPYAIFYLIGDGSIEIVRVIHTKRDFAAAFDDDA